LVRPADPLTHGQEPIVRTISFDDGDATTREIEIPLAGYNVLVGTQIVPMSLSNPVNGSLGGGPAQIGTDRYRMVGGRAPEKGVCSGSVCAYN
jgi:hypothetical protein